MASPLNGLGPRLAARRHELGMTVREVADKMSARLPPGTDVSHSYLTKIERGSQPLDAVDPHRLQALIVVLEISGPLYEDLCAAAPGLLDLEAHRSPSELVIDDEDDASWMATLLDSLGKLIAEGFVAAITQEGWSWAWGRLTHFRCHTNAAANQLHSVAESIIADRSRLKPELRALALLDTADAYCCAGKNGRDTMRYALLAELRAHDLWKERGRLQTQRRALGLARAMLMTQTVLMSRCGTGDPTIEDCCWLLHSTAAKYLLLAGDHYGFAKSYYNLAYIQLHKGELHLARALVTLGVEESRLISRVPSEDLMWDVRDGLRFFARTWWTAQTSSLQFDVAALSGETLRLPGLLWGKKDFPPFVPRYGWTSRIAHGGSEALERRRFTSWESHARRNGWLLYLPDILLSYGDFLLTLGYSAEAADRYTGARQEAQRLGFSLTQEAAEARLEGRYSVGALAQLLGSHAHLQSRGA